MGQNQPKELTEEEKKELSIDLLREWWLVATQALVDNVGASKALKLMAPGFRHHGRSAYHILAKTLSLVEEDINTVVAFECLGKTLMSGSPARVELREDGIIWTVEGCRTAGQCKEACLSYCYHTGMGMIEMFDEGMEFLLRESLSQGDARCLLSIGRRGKGLPVGKLIKVVLPENLGLSQQEWDFWSHADLGEVWAIVTRAAVEGLGEEKAVTMLEPYMNKSGTSLGLRMKGKFEGASAQGRALKAITMVQSCLGMEGDDGMSTNCSGEISKCPFSGAPMEICKQFEAFLAGLGEAWDPDLVFAYDRMMTKGDKTCHWTMRWKGEEALGGSKEAKAPDDPLRTLAMRFAKGEITEEELERKVANLRKLGLMK